MSWKELEDNKIPEEILKHMKENNMNIDDFKKEFEQNKSKYDNIQKKIKGKRPINEKVIQFWVSVP